MSKYDVHKLNRINEALPALDKAMLRCVDDDETLDGLAAAWVRLSCERSELRDAVATACAPWFKVWR